MRAIRRQAARLSAAAILLIPLLGVPGPAAALCAGPPDPNPIAGVGKSGVVFVGTAVETRSGGFTALFHVKEVWLGGPLHEWETVIGARPESQFFMVAEDTAHWTAGYEYLVVTYRQGDTLVGASSCGSGNRPYTAELAAYHPISVSSPLRAGRPLFWFAGELVVEFWVLLLVPAVLLAAAGAWLWRRLRRQERTTAA